MTDKQFTNSEPEVESFPVEPRYHPIHKIPRAIYDFLASAKLAMFLLVVILASCMIGVTVFREARAGELIFATLWFNALLILLVLNVACCFFGRIWHRKLTLITFGMILFHLSFITMFCGIVYNSLFYFRGIIRLTEGETLPNSDPQSYDIRERGRFFRYSRMPGETTVNKMLNHYTVDGQDKRVAYDITVGREGLNKNGLIYPTHNLDYEGFKFFPEKQGYSVLTVIYDKQGKELFGAYIPLQSLMQSKDNFIFSTGTKTGPGSFAFPPAPNQPLVELQVAFSPASVDALHGNVQFVVRPLGADMQPVKGAVAVKGKASVGSNLSVGEFQMSVKEVRSWVAMKVSYEPGQPLILASMWVGLVGLIVTFYGRVRGRKN